jgi:hypothetical protein
MDKLGLTVRKNAFTARICCAIFRLRGLNFLPNCQVMVEIHDLTPVGGNDLEVTKSVKRATEITLQGHPIDGREYITKGAEDFVYFQQKVSGMYFLSV